MIWHRLFFISRFQITIWTSLSSARSSSSSSSQVRTPPPCSNPHPCLWNRSFEVPLFFVFEDCQKTGCQSHNQSSSFGTSMCTPYIFEPYPGSVFFCNSGIDKSLPSLISQCFGEPQLRGFFLQRQKPRHNKTRVVGSPQSSDRNPLNSNSHSNLVSMMMR